ncbi:MAG: hypothetical protein CBC35_01160 [Planctomycetes bacterium TMED75]|nr:hypothetical protein [Planctomycetaceae bacterium]OUU96412.1 MAG: hypothetical protein CBC35_01160 [Planctomycetes bacterium TMED75]
MLLAQIDMSPFLSIGLGGLLLLTCAWYWQRLGRRDVEPSRRGIRRASLVLAALAIFALVRAASFVDSEISPADYVNSWLAAIGLLFLFVLLVGMDVLNSFFIYRRMLLQDALLAAQEIQSNLRQSSQDSVSINERDGTDEG